MGQPFTIKSALSDAELHFCDWDSHRFTVQLRGQELTAQRRVWLADDGPALVELLQRLVRHARGWPTPMQWEASESELFLRFRSDKQGHVFIAVEIAQHRGCEDWLVQAELQIELGQLARIAHDAAVFFECQPPSE